MSSHGRSGGARIRPQHRNLISNKNHNCSAKVGRNDADQYPKRRERHAESERARCLPLKASLPWQREAALGHGSTLLSVDDAWRCSRRCGRATGGQRPRPSLDSPGALPVLALVCACSPLRGVRHAPGADRQAHVSAMVHEMPLRAVRVVLCARLKSQGCKNRSR